MHNVYSLHAFSYIMLMAASQVTPLNQAIELPTRLPCNGPNPNLKKDGWIYFAMIVQNTRRTTAVTASCTHSFNVLLITYLLTYLLHGAESFLRSSGSQLVKKFPVFYWTRRFITAFTSVRHQSLSSGSSIQSILPHPTSWRFILISSPDLHPGLPSGLFPSGFTNKILYALILSPIRATCPDHLILLDLITRKISGEEYKSLSYSLCSFLQSPVISSLSAPNIPLSTLFSNTLNLHSSLKITDQFSHIYKKQAKL